MKVILFITLLASTSAFSFGALSFGGWPTSNRAQLKAELLKLSSETKRGLTRTTEQEERIKVLFEKMEKLNPTRKPLKSEKVNGVWSLEYTTSNSILGKGSFPKVGPILQMIDTTTLSALNSEVLNCFGIRVPMKVTAALSPQSDKLTNVQFKRFFMGPVGFNAPEAFKGSLDVTYLDNDFRLTRGDKGNIFVLTKQD
jgi:hypothetical protein